MRCLLLLLLLSSCLAVGVHGIFLHSILVYANIFTRSPHKLRRLLRTSQQYQLGRGIGGLGRNCLGHKIRPYLKGAPRKWPGNRCLLCMSFAGIKAQGRARELGSDTIYTDKYVTCICSMFSFDTAQALSNTLAAAHRLTYQFDYNNLCEH